MLLLCSLYYFYLAFSVYIALIYIQWFVSILFFCCVTAKMIYTTKMMSNAGNATWDKLNLHRSDALQSYKRETDEQQVRVSKIVQGQSGNNTSCVENFGGVEIGLRLAFMNV